MRVHKLLIICTAALIAFPSSSSANGLETLSEVVREAEGPVKVLLEEIKASGYKLAAPGTAIGVGGVATGVITVGTLGWVALCIGTPLLIHEINQRELQKIVENAPNIALCPVHNSPHPDALRDLNMSCSRKTEACREELEQQLTQIQETLETGAWTSANPEGETQSEWFERRQIEKSRLQQHSVTARSRTMYLHSIRATAEGESGEPPQTEKRHTTEHEAHDAQKEIPNLFLAYGSPEYLEYLTTDSPEATFLVTDVSGTLSAELYDDGEKESTTNLKMGQRLERLLKLKNLVGIGVLTRGGFDHPALQRGWYKDIKGRPGVVRQIFELALKLGAKKIIYIDDDLEPLREFSEVATRLGSDQGLKVNTVLYGYAPYEEVIGRLVDGTQYESSYQDVSYDISDKLRKPEPIERFEPIERPSTPSSKKQGWWKKFFGSE